MRRGNRINAQFATRLIEMLESPAWRVLSLSARRVVERIEIELAHHGGNDNGKLPVTYGDFVEYGIDRDCIAPAIREAEALGFIKVTEHGRGGNADYARPNKFLLTFAYAKSNKYGPSHDWRKVKTVEQAESIAREARGNKDSRAVSLGLLNSKKQNPVGKTPTGTSRQNPDRGVKFPSRQNPDYRASRKMPTTF
jgi:hypothetical protein